MKLTLMVEGSPSVIAAILATLPADATVAGPVPVSPQPMPVPQPIPSIQPAPVMPMQMPTGQTGGDDGDDDGPVANVADGEVDVNGIPWDDRIHAKTKAKTEAGAWRRRRGIDDATVAAVEAELRSRTAPAMPAAQPVYQPQPVAQQPAPIQMPPVMMQPVPQPGPLPVAAPQPMPQPAPQYAPVPMEQAAGGAAPVQSEPVMQMPVHQPVAQPAPVMPTTEQINTQVATATGTLDFAQFMQHLSGQMTKRDAAGQPLIHADYLANVTNEIANAFQTPLNAITDIAADPNKITYAVQLLQRDGRW